MEKIIRMERSTTCAVYAAESDITFIMRETYRGEHPDPDYVEVVGWHYGEPDANTALYIGKLKAEF